MFLLEVLASAGPDPLGVASGGSALDLITENAVLIGFIITTLWGYLTARGYKGIAAVNQVKLASGANIAPNQAKALAVALLRKYVPIIPVWLAESLIQFLFDKMKVSASRMQ